MEITTLQETLDTQTREMDDLKQQVTTITHERGQLQSKVTAQQYTLTSLEDHISQLKQEIRHKTVALDTVERVKNQIHADWTVLVQEQDRLRCENGELKQGLATIEQERSILRKERDDAREEALIARADASKAETIAQELLELQRSITKELDQARASIHLVRNIFLFFLKKKSGSISCHSFF